MWKGKKGTQKINVLVSVLSLSLLATPSTSATTTESFVFGGCSQQKYTPGSAYESNLNSLLTSLVNSAMFTTYNNFTIQSPSSSQNTVYGLFQCRGDLSPGDCGHCVARAIGQLSSLCPVSCGGALQLQGCFLKYDNVTFLGVEDKTEVLRRCGPSVGYDSDSLTRRDAVLDYVAAGDGSSGAYKPYRTGVSGDVFAAAQCVGDLSAGECQDCLSDAVGRLKTYCGATAWGDLYLAKCYAKFTKGGARSNGGGGGSNDNNNDDEIEKTLAILIGLIAGVALLIVFLSFLRKVCEKGKGGK
ncbi:Plasmodesmata-located protein 6 [Turnera subulata]|uniref:Plasmodesmata-located protein 6 n=1 Tax=Turnera subulata TaxID=218843 RepID=A0A9Q0F5T0_9ROSI|nr:Plasmodesmata-located protein 6 [Turnera subulata]